MYLESLVTLIFCIRPLFLFWSLEAIVFVLHIYSYFLLEKKMFHSPQWGYSRGQTMGHSRKVFVTSAK